MTRRVAKQNSESQEDAQKELSRRHLLRDLRYVLEDTLGMKPLKAESERGKGLNLKILNSEGLAIAKAKEVGYQRFEASIRAFMYASIDLKPEEKAELVDRSVRRIFHRYYGATVKLEIRMEKRDGTAITNPSEILIDEKADPLELLRGVPDRLQTRITEIDRWEIPIEVHTLSEASEA